MPCLSPRIGQGACTQARQAGASRSGSRSAPCHVPPPPPLDGGVMADASRAASTTSSGRSTGAAHGAYGHCPAKFSSCAPFRASRRTPGPAPPNSHALRYAARLPACLPARLPVCLGL